MNKMSESSRNSRIEDAGLILIGSEDKSELPPPHQGWKSITNLDATPARTIDDDCDDLLDKVDAGWLAAARTNELFADDGTFLISISGPGSFDLPWARVKLSEKLQLSRKIGPYPGQPEFVAMSNDGSVVCGVTSEEDEIWIVCAKPDQ